MFYLRFIEEYIINVSDWTLVRLKVRNLKNTYKKARDWAQGTGAGATNEGESIRGKTKQIENISI